MGIARSGVGWMVARFGALAVTWLASLYFARALVDPQATLGTYYAFETIVSFTILLANGGLNSAIVKRVSAGNDVPEFATAGLLMSGALVLLLSAGVVLASPFLIDFFGYNGISVIILIITLIAYQTKDTLSSLLESNFRIGRSGIVNFANATGQVFTQIILVTVGFGALGLVTGYMVGSVVAAIVAIGYVLQRFEWARPSKEHFVSLIKYSKYSFLNSFVQKFYDNVDIIIITYLLGKSSTGVYGIGFRFSLLLTVFYSAINRVSAPEISKHDTAGDEERIREVLSDSIVLWMLIGIPALFGFSILAKPIIVTFYTGEFAAATLVAVGAVATRIPEGLRSTIGSVVGGMDKPEIVFRGGAILMLTNIILDLALVPIIGVIGAVVASFIGMMFQLSYMSYYMVVLLDLTSADLPIKELILETLAAIVMAGIIYQIRKFIGISSFVEVFGLVGLGVIIYFILVLAIAPKVRARVVAIAHDLP